MVQSIHEPFNNLYAPYCGAHLSINEAQNNNICGPLDLGLELKGIVWVLQILGSLFRGRQRSTDMDSPVLRGRESSPWVLTPYGGKRTVN